MQKEMTIRHMTDEEIRRLWKNRAKSPVNTIRILADLNAVPCCVVRKKLEDLRLIEPGAYPLHGQKAVTSIPWTDEEHTTLISLRNDGASVRDIAAALHRSRASVEQKIFRYREKGVLIW